MTLCYDVFLSETFDDDDRDSLELMLHEIYHTVQCVNRGGVGPFVDEYLAHGIGTIVQTGRLDIHDDINFERDAARRADTVISAFGWPFVLKNGCVKPIRLFVHYWNTDGKWVNAGWYTFDPGEKAQITSRSEYVHSRGGYWYLYAEEINGDRRWGGSEEIDFDGKTYNAIEKYEREPGGSLGTTLTCQ